MTDGIPHLSGPLEALQRAIATSRSFVPLHTKMANLGSSNSSNRKRPRARRFGRKKKTRFEWGITKDFRMKSDSESDVDSSTLDFQPITLPKELFPEHQFGSENVEKNASMDRELSFGTNPAELDEEYCQSHMSGHTDPAGQSAIFSEINRTEVQASECVNESEHIPHLQQELDYSRVESLSESERNSFLSVNPPPKKIESWQRLVAVLAVTGTNRLTSDQYKFFRNKINWALQSYAPREKLLPSFSTIQRSIFPSLLRNNFPVCKMFNMHVNMNKAGARASIMKKVNSIDARDSGQASLPPTDEDLPKAAVLVINPSAWAEMDVSCKPTWDLLKMGTADEGRCDLECPHFNTIARAPIVSQRSDILEKPHFAIFSARSHSNYCDNFLIPGENVTIVLESQGEQELHAGSCIDELDGVLGETKLARSVDNGAGRTLDSVQTVRSNEERSNLRNGNPGKPGDMYTLFHPTSFPNSLCMIIHRRGGYCASGTKTELVWIPKTTPSLCGTENDYQHHRRPQPILKITAHAISTAQATTGLPYHRDDENRGASNRRCTSEEETCQCALSHGYILGSNARYFVYRVLLYSDGFNQYKEKQGSAGGVYMLPLNLLPEHRRSRRSVRLLGLTPPGVNTSDVLHLIADDLFRAATDGIHTTDAEGNPVVVYIQVIGYIGDFLEIAHVSDLLGHNSDAACHLCFFRKQKINPNKSSNGYTTEISSRNSSCFRSGPRAQAIRQSAQSENEKRRELQFLGMTPSSSHKTRRNPMFYLHRKMNEAKESGKIPKAKCGHHIFDPSFDPYRSVLVAPDHLLAGNAINILTTCFLLIQSHESIRRIDARLCESLKANMLVKQGSIYDFKNKKLYTTSISGTFSILLVAGRVFSDEFGKRSTTHRLTPQPPSALQEAVNVLGMLEDLIAKTYWYPKINVDGYKAVTNFNRAKGFDRLKELMEYSCEYVKACDRLCRISEHAKRHIDKPNLHRIIELFTHSIPAMGHVRHFSELLFECAHQPLKRGVAMSNRRDPQLQSARHVLADDWQNRLAAITHKTHTGNYADLESLKRFLDGKLHTPVTSNATDARENVSESILIRPVLEKLLSEQNSPNSNSYKMHWKTMHRDRRPDKQLESLLDKIVIHQHDGKRRVMFFKFARRYKKVTSGCQTAFMPDMCDKISTGDAIQVLVHRSMTRNLVLPLPSTSELLQSPVDYVLCVFAIARILEWEDESAGGPVAKSGPYAFVYRCNRYGGGFLRVDETDDCHLLQLNANVRRVGLIHACSLSRATPQCKVIDDGDYFLHNETLLEGGNFYYITREMGYPPRMA